MILRSRVLSKCFAILLPDLFGRLFHFLLVSQATHELFINIYSDAVSTFTHITDALIFTVLLLSAMIVSFALIFVQMRISYVLQSTLKLPNRFGTANIFGRPRRLSIGRNMITGGVLILNLALSSCCGCPRSFTVCLFLFELHVLGCWLRYPLRLLTYRTISTMIKPIGGILALIETLFIRLFIVLLPSLIFIMPFTMPFPITFT